MRTKFCLPVWMMMVLTMTLWSGRLSAAEGTLGEHPFFKLLAGKWKSDGEMKGADGKVQKYTAEWTGSGKEDGSFVLEGTREIGEDKTPQQYRWVFNRGSGEGLFEAVHEEVLSGSNNTKAFEVSCSEATLTLEMTAFLSSGNSKITVKETFVDESHEKLQTAVEFTDDQGNVTLTVNINNERQKEP